MKKRILLIEDDTKLTALLSEFLTTSGYSVAVANHPRQGMRLVAQESWDLLILDVMLPEVNGFELCKQIRERHSVPIILLTARGDVNDRVVGLDSGADDYLPKPFEPKELLARVKSVLRRANTNESAQKIISGDLEIDMVARTVTLAKKPLDLTTSEFDVLALLAKNPQRVFNRDQIMDALRGTTWEAFNRSIDVLISRLRQKLNDNAKQPLYIKTIWGSGYSFVGKVESKSNAA